MSDFLSDLLGMGQRTGGMHDPYAQMRSQQESAYQSALSAFGNMQRSNMAAQMNFQPIQCLNSFYQKPDPCEVSARKELEEYLGPIPEVPDDL